MSTTLARQLEAAFRPVLAAALTGVSLRLLNEDATGATLPLPAVVLSARELDVNYTVKVAGRFASNMELRAACRVDGNAALSTQTAEALAGGAKAAIEGAAITSGWLFLQLHPQDDERQFEGGTRVHAVVWKVIALASV